MARVENIIMQGTRGSIGKQLVYRVRGGKTFASKHPDMSRVKPSEKQLAEKSKFAEAVRFACEVINDPVRKAAYKAEEGRSVYHTAIRDWLEAHK